MKTYDEVAKVTYEGPDSREPFAFKYYNPDEMLGGKPMREHLRFALSWWHTLCADGVDMFGGSTMDKAFGKALIFVGLAEGVALYGLIVALLLLFV